MTIHSLTIENLRGFAGKHEIVFTDKHVAAFIGVNGSGKSTVLEAVGVCLSLLIGSINKVDGDSDNHFNRLDVNNTVDIASWALAFKYIERPSIYRLSQTIYNRAGTYDGSAGAYGVAESDLINQLKTDIVKDDKEVPVIGFYHNSRTNYSNDPESSYNHLIFDRLQTYHGALKANVNFDLIAAFYTHVLNLENNQKVLVGDLDFESSLARTFREGTKQFLAILLGDESQNSVQLVTQGFRQVLAYEKNGSELYLSQLSSGEKAILGILMDLIYRCVSANSHLKYPLHSPGIVLIDEIELHLHPRWQANIIKALTTTFPNIQFIISTHAPLVINQLQSDQLFLLKKDGIVPGADLQEIYGMEAGDVISQVMGAPPRPVAVSKQFENIAELLDEPTAKNLHKAKEILEELGKTISPNDVDIIKFQTLLTYEESAADF